MTQMMPNMWMLMMAMNMMTNCYLMKTIKSTKMKKIKMKNKIKYNNW